MDITLLKHSPLFQGMSEPEIQDALRVLRAHQKTFCKDHLILCAGDTTQVMGVILSGSVTIEHDDLWGSRTILSLAETGDFFAEVYAISGSEPLLIDVRANEDCRILFLTAEIPEDEPSAPWHIRFVRNLLNISASKNLLLSGRSLHTSAKTVRGRIMAYLDTMVRRKQSREFDIPFNRQQMADYLNIERTALSKELGRMQRENLITFRHNHFRIETLQ